MGPDLSPLDRPGGTFQGAIKRSARHSWRFIMIKIWSSIEFLDPTG